MPSNQMADEAAKKARRIALLVAVAISLCFGFVAFNRTYHNQIGFDFRAYYGAAERFVHGQPVYLRESEALLFKYAPVSLLAFVPFSWFPFGPALWIYALLCLGAVLATPWLVVRIFSRTPVAGVSLNASSIMAALGVSFLGTLRLIDSEFLVSQIGSLMFFVTLLGVDLLLGARTDLQLWVGWLVAGLGAIPKIHPMAAFGLFWPELLTKRAWIALSALVVLLLLPDPRLWLEWAEQMRVTTDWIPMDRISTNLQGLQPFAIRYFGFGRHDLRMYVLCGVLFLLLIGLLPHFDLERAKARPPALVYAFGALVLFGMLVSPLPWQYTYVPFWGLCFASWLGASLRERRVLLAISLFLALSPKGIAGESLALGIEHRQGIAIAMGCFVILLARQARRYARA